MGSPTRWRTAGWLAAAAAAGPLVKFARPDCPDSASTLIYLALCVAVGFAVGLPLAKVADRPEGPT